MYVLEFAGEDDAFAAAEAATAAAGVEVIAPGLATATAVTDRIRTLAFTRRASELLGRTDPTVESARSLLGAATLDRSGSVAVRARDVRGTTAVDTQAAEHVLGAVLVDRGFDVDLEDPDHELRALFSDGVGALGWLSAESVRDYGDRVPTDRPFFQPGSMGPLLARALANLAGAGPGATVVDPMCGTGGILIEAGVVGARVVGVDAQDEMVRGAARNLTAALDADGSFDVLRGDATRLPIHADRADAVVFDAPYGRQSKIEGTDLDGLVAGALGEARRIAPRAVVVGDRSRASAAAAAGWTVEQEFERPVHRSLTRYVLVLG